MPYTIEFYFDPVFEDMLLNVWGKMAEAGVPSYYQIRGVRPHLTLAVLEQGDEARLRDIVNSFSQSLPALTVTFVGVMLIPSDRCSVALGPLVTQELFDIQAMLYDQLCAGGNPPIQRYAPGQWLPCGSISKDLSFPDALRTVELCGKHIRVGAARMRELGCAEFTPRRQIVDIVLDREFAGDCL